MILTSCGRAVLSAAIVLFGVPLFTTDNAVVHAESADPLNFPACPETHSPEYFCCKYSDATMEVFTKFNLPTGGAYESDYRDGWALGRKVNYPYHKFTPDTPTFYYDEPDTVCRMRVIVTDFTTGETTQELQCATSDDKDFSSSISVNASLIEDSQDSTVYWTSPTNARNNNASFPIGAECTSLMDVAGSVNATAKSLCVSTSAAVTPQFVTYRESKLVVIYVLYALVFVFLGLWAFYKQQHHVGVSKNAKNSSKQDLEMAQKLLTDPVTPPPYHKQAELVAQTGTAESALDASVDQSGFSSSFVGRLVFAYFLLATLALHALVIIAICDYYAKFTPTLFGPHNALVFFLVWLVAALWLASVVAFKHTVRNFFRLSASLDQCEYVHMVRHEEPGSDGDGEVLLADRSGVSDLVARVEAAFSFFSSNTTGSVRYQETVKVQIIGDRRVVEFQHMRYVYDDDIRRFIPGTVALSRSVAVAAAAAAHVGGSSSPADGLSAFEAARRLNLVGANAVEVEMPSLAKSLLLEFITLFYVYQVTSYYVWYYFSYWNLGIIMTVVVVGTAAVNIWSSRHMQAAVVMLTRYESHVEVWRRQESSSGVWVKIDSRELVPGDLVRVQENWVLPCDLVLVSGLTVCDESMLTGESMPVQKSSLPSTAVLEDPGASTVDYGKKHTLFAGTRVLESGRGEEILAIVQSTGAYTTKGKLVQSILFPVRMRFKYDEHLKALIVLLLVYAVIACYLGISFLTSNGKLTNKMTAFCYCIFLISAVVSPLLPVVITVGQVNAAKRLSSRGIFSLNVQRITLFGKVRVFCFDKTGTLTKQGLDFLGVQQVRNVDGQDARFDPSVINDVSAGSSSTVNSLLQFALATCHSVSSLNGGLVGNEVEVRMLEATGWSLVDSTKTKDGVSTTPFVKSQSTELEFVKRFEFDHARMSMSVVVRDKATGKLFVFCKGSYERMQQLSRAESVPSNYTSIADAHARQGCYVLGIAGRELPSDWTPEQVSAFIADRDSVDSSLSLLGLLLFRNELKPDTPAAIAQLKAGDIRTVMITGDNALCGCYIARASGIIAPDARVLLGEVVNGAGVKDRVVWRAIGDDESESETVYTLGEVKQLIASGDNIELAVNGEAFDFLKASSELTSSTEENSLLLKIRIFSRMTPDGKVACVRLHMAAGLVTGMCGDGGNDCGALRLAHAGVALSDAEASVVSPFTSKPKSIQSVVDLCREGRGALATSFASVKFLIMYGVIASTLRLFQWYHAVIMSEWCFILADGVTLVGLSYVITLSRPLPELGDQRPTSSLIGPTTLVSLVGQELINVVFLFNGVHMLIREKWYCPFTPDNVDLAKWWLLSDNHMATVLFFTVITQQHVAAWVFSFGSRFRASIWRNYFLVFVYALLITLDVYLILGGPSDLTDLFRIASSTNVIVLPYIPMPLSFRLKYFALLVGNVAAVILFEYVVVLGPVRDYLRRRYHKDRFSLRK